MGIKTVLLVDGGHLNAVRQDFAKAHPMLFRYWSHEEQEFRTRGIDMGAFRDWCLSCCANNAELVFKPIFYDGKPRYATPLPDDPEWVWETRAWTAEERENRAREMRNKGERDRFHYSLRTRHGYETRLGRVVCRPVPAAAPGTFYPPSQKEVDTQIAVDIVDIVWRHPEIRQIVLVSADSDLRRPILYARFPHLLAGPGPEPPALQRPTGSRKPLPEPRTVVLIHGPERHKGSYKGIMDSADRCREITKDSLLDKLC